MTSITHPACTPSESQLTIHLLVPFGAPPANVVYPFLRRAVSPGPPRGTVVVVQTPLPNFLACQVNHAQNFALSLRVLIEPRADVVDRIHGSESRPDGPTNGAILGSGGDGRPAP